MTIDEYITNRLDNQQKWFSEKSTINKNKYLFFSYCSIVCSILVPLIIDVSLLAGTILSAIVAIFIAINNFGKYHQKWIEYRNASELLKSEKYRSQSSSGEYHSLENETDRLNLLVENVEYIISRVNETWKNNIVINQNIEQQSHD